MKFFRRLNLTAKLFIINFGSVFFFAFILLLIFNRGIGMQKDVIGKNMQLYSEVLVKSLSEVFHSKYHNIQAIAKNSALKTTDKETIKYVFDEMMTLYPDFGYLALVGKDGKIIATNSINSAGKEINYKAVADQNVANQEWFQRAKNQKFTEDLEKKIFGTYVGRINKDSVAKSMYGKDVVGNHFTTIVDDGFGEVQAILTVYVKNDWIEQALIDLYKSTKSNSESELAFINDEGKMGAFVHYDQSGKKVNDDSLLLNKTVLNNSSEIGKLILSKGNGTAQEDSILNGSGEMYYAGSKVVGKKIIDSLGWSVLIGVKPKTLFLPVRDLQNFFYIFAAILLIISAGINYFGGRIASVPIQKIADILRKNASKVKEVATMIDTGSVQLSSNTTQQASSIEQISASLEETNVMVENNATSSKLVMDLANDTHNEATNGKEVMTDLRTSIDEIMKSTQSIEQLKSVIEEIGEKTKVIDEIVFQTKLLSFNASVEAERAGEHGRGFAVVAQEVGNLASMSGKAAMEIAAIVKDSINKAGVVVTDNKEKVERGNQLSIKTSELLESIEKKTDEVRTQSEQISKASEEQALGIKQINTAINQIDDVTQLVSKNAGEFAETGKEMNLQAEDLNRSVIQLLEIIKGEGSQRGELSSMEVAPAIEPKEISIPTPTFRDERPIKDIKKSITPVSQQSDDNWDTL